MSKVVGIDLGTTNSLVAYVKDSVPVVIRDPGGDGLIPSVVSVAEDHTVYVGREAERRLVTDPGRTIYSVKRFMGKGLHDVGDEARLFPFRLAGDPGGIVKIGLGAREFTAPASAPPRLASARNRNVRKISADTSTGVRTPLRVSICTMPGASMKRYGKRLASERSARPRPISRLTDTIVFCGSTTSASCAE